MTGETPDRGLARPPCKECLAYSSLEGNVEQGECRRHPPAVGGDGFYRRFPLVRHDDWCVECVVPATPAWKTAIRQYNAEMFG